MKQEKNNPPPTFFCLFACVRVCFFIIMIIIHHPSFIILLLCFFVVVDVVKVNDEEHKYMFYEVYKDKEAAAFHREQPHFKLYSDFKASGGILKSGSTKTTGVFMSK